ncbi:uncharacterized protein LOC127840063 isoform X2 [Dreissena polymorpha]|uniref:uncharacterized protein LOC127840063 isoform X2 n=1 Tax=Dreissena polymorpha TaxID=45954 RepID=UPI002264ABED|nr:uncharacterized protein LOC127840063 isoform X2 [Dreissena polymorpha]
MNPNHFMQRQMVPSQPVMPQNPLNYPGGNTAGLIGNPGFPGVAPGMVSHPGSNPFSVQHSGFGGLGLAPGSLFFSNSSGQVRPQFQPGQEHKNLQQNITGVSSLGPLLPQSALYQPTPLAVSNKPKSILKNSGSSDAQMTTSVASQPKSILKNLPASTAAGYWSTQSTGKVTNTAAAGRSIPTLVSAQRMDTKRKVEPSVPVKDSQKKQKLDQGYTLKGQADEEEDPEYVQAQIFIGNIPADTDRRVVADILKHYQLETRVWMAQHAVNQGLCAFVKLPTMKDSKRVIAEMKGFPFRNKPMEVRFTAAADFETYKIIPDNPYSVAPNVPMATPPVYQATPPIQPLATPPVYQATPPVYQATPSFYPMGVAPSALTLGARVPIGVPPIGSQSYVSYPPFQQSATNLSASPILDKSSKRSRSRSISPKGRFGDRGHSRSPRRRAKDRERSGQGHSSDKGHGHSDEKHQGHSVERQASRRDISPRRRSPDDRLPRKRSVERSIKKRSRSRGRSPRRHSTDRYSDDNRYSKTKHSQSPTTTRYSSRMGHSVSPVSDQLHSKQKTGHDTRTISRHSERRHLSSSPVSDKSGLSHHQMYPPGYVTQEFLPESAMMFHQPVYAPVWYATNVPTMDGMAMPSFHYVEGMAYADNYLHDKLDETGPRGEHVVFIGGLPVDVSDIAMEDFIHPYNYESVHLKVRYGKAYAYVYFHSYHDADIMVRQLNGERLYGREVTVEHDKGDQQKEPLEDRVFHVSQVEVKPESSLFQKFVDASYAAAPVLGRKYITEYKLSDGSTAHYVCLLCESVCSWKSVADHVMGYKHRLNALKRSHPKIHQELTQMKDKVEMLSKCAQYASELVNNSEQITSHIVENPESAANNQLNRLKEKHQTEREGKRKPKPSGRVNKTDKKSPITKQDATSDIFRRIEAYKKKFASQSDDKPSSSSTKRKLESEKKTNFEELKKTNKPLADTIESGIISARKKSEEQSKPKETDGKHRTSQRYSNERKGERQKREDRPMKLDPKKVVEDAKKRLEQGKSLDNKYLSVSRISKDPKESKKEEAERAKNKITEENVLVSEEQVVVSAEKQTEKVDAEMQIIDLTVTEEENINKETHEDVADDVKKGTGENKEDNSEVKKGTGENKEDNSEEAMLFEGELGDMDAEVEREASEPDKKTLQKTECRLSGDPRSQLDKYFASQAKQNPDNQWIVGLQYVTEVLSTKPRRPHLYECSLCNTKCYNKCIASHVCGYKHRMKYLELHQADIYTTLQAKDEPRRAMMTHAGREAQLIQQREGTHTVMSVSEVDYYKEQKNEKMLKRAQKAQAPAVHTIYKNLPDLNTTGTETTAITIDLTQSAEKVKVNSEMTSGANEAQETNSKEKKGKIHWTFKIHCRFKEKLLKAKAAAKMVKREDGKHWVRLYKYISSKPEVPLLGLNYVTEILHLYGPTNNTPVYTCELCLSHTKLDGISTIYDHIIGIKHMDNYLQKHHMEKIPAMRQLQSKGSKLEYLLMQAKVIQATHGASSLRVVDLNKVEEAERAARKAELELKQKQEQLAEIAERAKKEVALFASSKAAMDTGPTGTSATNTKVVAMETESNEFAGRHLTTGSVEAKLYATLKALSTKAVVGLNYITEIQDSLGCSYSCKLCSEEAIRSAAIIPHLTSPRHRLIFLQVNYPVLHSKSEGNQDLVNQYCTEIEEQFGREAISVMQRRTDGKLSKPVLVKGSPKKKMAAIAATDDEWLETLKSMDEEIRKLSHGQSQTEVTGSEVKVTEDEDNIVLYKILQGLDYTPMLGLQYITEIHHPDQHRSPVYECEVCGNVRANFLTTRNILKHITSKGHKMSFFKENHLHIYNEISSEKNDEAQKALITRHTEELESKIGRGSVLRRVEADEVFWPADDPSLLKIHSPLAGVSGGDVTKPKNGPERFRCKLCGYLIRNLRLSATNHISYAHSFPYECDKCVFKARGKTALAKHYKKNHNTEALVDFIDVSFNAMFETVYTMKLGTYMDTDGKVQAKPIRVSRQKRPLAMGTAASINKNVSAPQGTGETCTTTTSSESALSIAQTADISLTRNTMSTSVQTTLPGSVQTAKQEPVQALPSYPVLAPSHTVQPLTMVDSNLRPQQTAALHSTAETWTGIKSNTQDAVLTSQNVASNSAGLNNLADKGQNISAVGVVSTITQSVGQGIAHIRMEMENTATATAGELANKAMPPSQSALTHGSPQGVLPFLQQSTVSQTHGIIIPVQQGMQENQSEPEPVTGLDLVKSAVHQALETELKSSQQTASEKLGQEEALNICHILAEKEDPDFDWLVENGILMSKMQQGLIFLSARKSKFLMNYASTFSSHPLLGLQHIKEYQRLDIRLDSFYMCELCRDKLGPTTIANHFKSLKHNLWYMGKEHQDDYSTIVALCKDKSILTRSELQREVDSLSLSIMKTENRPRLIPVFVEKAAPVSTPAPSLDGSSSASVENSRNITTANKTTASTHKTTAASKTIKSSPTAQKSSRRHRSGSRERRHSRSPRSSRRHDRSRDRHNKSSRRTSRSSRYETSKSHSQKRHRSNERDNEICKEKRAKIDASISENTDRTKEDTKKSTKLAKTVEEDTTITTIDLEQVTSPEDIFDEGDMLTEEDMRILELQLLKQSELDEDELAVHEDLEDANIQEVSDTEEAYVSVSDNIKGELDSANRKGNSWAEGGVLKENQISVIIELTVDSPINVSGQNKENTDKALENTAEHAALQGDIVVAVDVPGSDKTDSGKKGEGNKSLTKGIDVTGGNSIVQRPEVESSSDVVHVNIEIHETSELGIRKATVPNASMVSTSTVEKRIASSAQSVPEKDLSTQAQKDQSTVSSENINSEGSTLASEKVHLEIIDTEKEAKFKNDFKENDELGAFSDKDSEQEFGNHDEDFITSQLGEGFVTVDDIEDENTGKVNNIQEKTVLEILGPRTFEKEVLGNESKRLEESNEKTDTTHWSSKGNHLQTTGVNKADFEGKSPYCDKADTVDFVKLNKESNTEEIYEHNSQAQNADVIDLKEDEKEILRPANIKSPISFDTVNVDIQTERNKEHPEYQDHETKSDKTALIIVLDEKVDKYQDDSVIFNAGTGTKNEHTDNNTQDSQMVAEDIDLMDELEKALANDEQFFNSEQDDEANITDEETGEDIIHADSMNNDTNFGLKSDHPEQDSIIEDKTIIEPKSDVGVDNEPDKMKEAAGAADNDDEDKSDADSEGSFDMDNFVLVDDADEDEDIEDEPDSGEYPGSSWMSKEQGPADEFRPEGNRSSSMEGVPKSRGDSKSGARVSQTRSGSEKYERSSQASSSHSYQGDSRRGNFSPSRGRGSFRAKEKYYWSRTTTEASRGNDRGNQAIGQGTGNQSITGGKGNHTRGRGNHTRGRGYQTRGSGYQTRGNSQGDYNTSGRGSYSHGRGRGSKRGWSNEESYPRSRGRGSFRSRGGRGGSRLNDGTCEITLEFD